ncbi:PAS domain S-box protein [Desulforamulus ferrireducens]|nr:PAS domain S-box protein [Desulforamulus ferrireducens]
MILLIYQFEQSLFWASLMNASLVLGTLLLVLGTLNFSGKKANLSLYFISALGMVWYTFGFYFNISYILLNLPIFILVGTATILTGLIYLTLQEAKKTGKIITASSFLLIGLNNLMYPLSVWIHTPISFIYLVSMLAKLGITIGTLILHFERNKINLDKTQTSYKVLAENTTDIIFRYTFQPHQHLEYINPAFTTATGYACEEILSNPSLIKNILHPNYHHLAKQLLAEPLHSETTFEFAVYHKNGQIVYLESHSIPQYSSDGQLLAIEGIIRDVTQRKQMEEEIRMLEEQQKKQMKKALSMAEDRFSKAFYNSPYPMAIISKDYSNIHVNYSFEKSIGYQQQDFVSGKVNFKDFLTEKKEYLKLTKLLEQGVSIRNYKFKFINKAREEGIGLLSVEKIEFDNRESFLLAINDISDLKRMEKELTRLDRLNLIGQMAAGIGHEVRNPMTTVRGFLQMFRGREQYSELNKYFDLMISELDRVNSLITNFLSLAKKTPPELEPQNLNKIINNLRPLLETDALSQDKHILVELADIPEVYMNRNEIHQLILNLVRNGLEAMAKGGTIRLRTFMDGEEIVLAVTDEGSGIAPSVLEKLGTPFLTTKAEGTGLGLATCYSIADRHKARINVDTGPTGTTFFVRFHPSGP